MTWDKRVPEGPYFVSEDPAEDTVDHKHSGLAMVDTGRSMDWPIARLCEWPTAQFISASWDMYQALRIALELAGGWREAITELEDFCHEPVRLKNMMIAVNQLDEFTRTARKAIAQADGAEGYEAYE